jgi:His/Glu/Gln/Arg/opine family amino acid ABC transporter permease subunit
MVTTTVDTPPDRGWRYKLRNQTPMSRTVLASGILVLVFLIVGSIAVLTAFGWTQVCPEGVTRLECSPSDPLARGISSNGYGLVSQITLAIGGLIAVAGFALYRFMPNRPSRDAAVGGAVLAVQAMILAGLVLWFRGTDVDRFARNFLNFSLIGQKSGLVWQSIVDSIKEFGLRFDFTAGRPSFGIDGLVLTTAVAGAGAALLTNMVAAVQRGAASLIGRLFLGGIGLGVAQGLWYGLAEGDLIVEVAVRTFIWGLLALAIGVVVVGGRELFRAFAESNLKPTLWSLAAGVAIGIIWAILSVSIAPSFVKGAKNTLVLSAAGAALGFGLGLVLALFTMSSRSVVRAPARVYINFFRGTPLIWQISFAGIGFVPALRLNLDMYAIAILVLGLNLAAYSAEVYRAGIQSLERGQMEAARTVGLSYFQSMRFVVVPQAIRRVIPPLLNEFVILIKDTSLVSVLGLTVAQKELLGVGRDIYSSFFDATAWIGAAAGYLIITIPMIRIVTIVERRLRSGLTSVIG